MSRQDVTAVVTELTLPIFKELNLELVDVEYVKEGANWYLRFFIDKAEGIEIDDCQAASQKLNPILDEADPIPDAYILEVSSPGLDRPLKKDSDFERFKGELIKVITFSPFEGQKLFVGELGGLQDDQVSIKTKDQEFQIPRSKISSVRLEVQF